MHCYGDMLHDALANLPMILPLLAPLLFWRRKTPRSGVLVPGAENKRCDHKHEGPYR